MDGTIHHLRDRAEQVLVALRVLGVEGPATAQDVLAAAGTRLSEPELATVMGELTGQARATASGWRKVAPLWPRPTRRRPAGLAARVEAEGRRQYGTRIDGTHGLGTA